MPLPPLSPALTFLLVRVPCRASVHWSSLHSTLAPHSRPVCYLYVLPVCYLHAVSKLRTSQSSIPGQYAIYTYCQCAIYMLLRSFKLPNLPFLASMLSICIASMLFICFSKLRTSQSSIPGQYAIYTYCQYAIYMLLRSFEPPNLPFLASMLSIRIASMLFTCCFEASNHSIFHSRPVCYLYVLPVCYLHAVSKLRTTQSSIPGQYAIYMYCQYAIYMLLRTTQSSIPGYMISIRIASTHFTCCFKASNHPIFHSRRVCYLYFLPVCYLYAASKLRTTQSSNPGQYAIYTYFQYTIYMLLRSFEPPNLLFPASILSIPIDSMLFTCCFEPPNLPFLASMLSIRIASMLFTCCFEPPNLPFLASMLSIRIASMLFICCFEASNHPIFYSRPVCYLYVLPVCYLHAASNHPIFHSWPVCYLYVLPVCYLHAASNHPIFHSWPVCYLYVLPVCYLYAASKLRTTQSSIPGQYAIYTYCQYAIYMLLRSFEPPNLLFPASMLSIRIASMLFTCCFEPPNLPFLASMLSICIASMLFTCCFEPPNLPFPASMLSIRIASMLFICCFEASNHPIFYSRPVCYLYVLPVCYLYAASKLRTTQSSIPGQYAIYTYCQYAIYMLLRSFEPPNLPFPASMLSIRIASMLFTCCFEPPNLPFLASMLSIRIASMLFICCFEASNHPIFYSRPVCYLYVLPVCYLHAASNHPIFHSWPVCYLYVLPVCYLHAASNHPIFHSWPVCYLYVLPVCYLHAVSKLRTTQSSIPSQYSLNGMHTLRWIVCVWARLTGLVFIVPHLSYL